MRNLIKAEFYKLVKSFEYRVLLALGAGYGLFFCWLAFSNSSRIEGYRVLSSMHSFVLCHAILTGAFAAFFLCGEFSGRTMGMSLLCGLPRRSVFLSKLTVYFAGLLCLLSAVAWLPTVIISCVNGYGMELGLENCLDILAQVLFFWLVSAALGGCFVLLALVTKSAIATIGVGVGTSFMLLFMTTTYLNAGEESYYRIKYSVIYQMFVLDNWEYVQRGLFVGVNLVTLVVALTAAVMVFERSELK